MKEILDGNKACSITAYKFSDMACIYPITPSSPMASNIDALASSGEKNFFGDTVKVVEMQSEAGAIGSMHGALLTGSLTSTFTASQGLLLMIPNMYKIAGEGLPGVIHVASRTVATHALSIFGDHSDVYATRQTGFCILASTNVCDAHNLASVAHLSAIKGSLPFIHFFDGFRTSHELNTIELLDFEKVKNLIDYEKLDEYRKRTMNIGQNVQYGMAENEDIYFQSVEARSDLYANMPDIVNEYMQEINKLTGTKYAPFVYYGAEDAENIIIAMGSVCDTIKNVLNNQSSNDSKWGLIEVHLYRPFSTKYLLNVLPETVKRIAVLDRTKESGSLGEPLYLDVLAALKNHEITIVGGRYGLSSKDTTPSEIYSIYKMLEDNPKNHFTIGINDDLNDSNIPMYDYNIKMHAREYLVYGFGSDGMVSASKDFLHLLGKDSYVQGYFEYDSKKSGGVTVSHLRVDNQRINSPYYASSADAIVVTKDVYLSKFAIFDKLKDNGIVIINTNDITKCLSDFHQQDLDLLKKRNALIYVIDATKIADKFELNGKINKIIECVLLHVLGYDDKIEELIKGIDIIFKTKGEDVIRRNKEAVKEAIANLQMIKIADDFNTNLINSKSDIFERINARQGNELKVSDLVPFRTGCFPGGLAAKEKRKISNKVARWIPENCIQCGMCSFVCPHAVIRPFLINDEKGLPAIGASDYHYLICVSEADCTGCGLCVSVCPGKNGKKALELEAPNFDKSKDSDYYFNEYENPKILPKFTIKGSQLLRPHFAFSGACAGCGETAYIKLLTQLYGDEIVIANATGCSSIYGGSAPSTPYTLPWANSLFEDNAEFAFGMHISYQVKRKRIFKIAQEWLIKNPNDEVIQRLIDSFDDAIVTRQIKDELTTRPDNPIPKSLLDYIPARTIWGIGGDGWAYDIGFGGLDHVLSSNENVKILVLDTEVYSNTGGQMSKSSHMGQICEFADMGKKTDKKDLFKIAMCYPNCYVASISLGANMMQTLKVFEEAEKHHGPSLIIAYSPCVEHGIKGGLRCSIDEQKLAVNVGYSLLMRYKPEEQRLYLDSKEPDFNRYEEFLNHEVRYNALKIKNADYAHELLTKNRLSAEKRYDYYRKLSEQKKEDL